MHAAKLLISAALTLSFFSPAAFADGKKTYESGCIACHGSGVAGAPKVGDADKWASRIEQGMDVLAEHAIKGYQGKEGYMPAKGGNPNLPDDDVKVAVEYMVAQSQ